jgi:gamma-glutamylcyclotransferase (GGCT)/AIG2-like uncharacterized protein YtfP
VCAREGIPLQAVGGVAARAWGAQRDLVDLDFYVPDAALPLLARHAAGAVRGPDRVRGGLWDVSVLTLEMHGCRVELGGAETARYRDCRSHTWSAADIDFDRSETRAVFGQAIPVIPKDALIAYKTALGRDVDLVDLYGLLGEAAVGTRLVAYGTLRPGEPNQHILRSVRGEWAPGTVTGHLESDGWGMTCGFPALVWHPDAPPVSVELFTAPGLPQQWDRLDAFEGDAYRRIVVPVHRGEDRVLANIYVLRWPQ